MLQTRARSNRPLAHPWIPALVLSAGVLALPACSAISTGAAPQNAPTTIAMATRTANPSDQPHPPHSTISDASFAPSDVVDIATWPSADRAWRVPSPRAARLADDAAFGRPVVDATSTASVDTPEGLVRLSFAEEGADFNPRISRDGTWMVFASTQHRNTADLYKAQVGGRTVTQLTNDPANDVMPAISPDGSRIAFASDRSGRWNLYMISSSGGQAVQLTNDHAHDLHPSWSPDGTRLVFCRLGARSGRWELWVLDLARAASPEFIGYGAFPEWCPVPGAGNDGADRIVFQRGRERGDRAFSIWTIDYRPGSSGNPTQVVSGRTFSAINPTWSPDGRWIAFTSVPLDAVQEWTAGEPGAAPDAQRTELWITAVDGSARVNVASGPHSHVMPVWSTDNRITFVSDRGGTDNIWSISAEKALAAAAGITASGHPRNAAAPGPAHTPARVADVPTLP
jgi:TolB protein